MRKTNWKESQIVNMWIEGIHSPASRDFVQRNIRIRMKSLSQSHPLVRNAWPITRILNSTDAIRRRQRLRGVVNTGADLCKQRYYEIGANISSAKYVSFCLYPQKYSIVLFFRPNYFRTKSIYSCGWTIKTQVIYN